MNRNQLLTLLSELVACHAPPGEEREIEAVIWREFEATHPPTGSTTGLKVWQDGATNIYAHLPGQGPKVMICAHKDELGMIITHIQPDGRLKVTNIGGALPWKYGEGPVDVLADDGSAIRAILSVGSVHTRSGPMAELKSSRALTWDLVTLFTGLAPDQLAAKGVHAGSRAVVARERKAIQRLGEYIASYALDDRMGLVAIVAGLKEMAQTTRTEERPDCYFVATHGEEIGMLGAVRAAQVLQPEICIAIDTSPVTHDTPTALDPRPSSGMARRPIITKLTATPSCVWPMSWALGRSRPSILGPVLTPGGSSRPAWPGAPSPLASPATIRTATRLLTLTHWSM